MGRLILWIGWPIPFEVIMPTMPPIVRSPAQGGRADYDRTRYRAKISRKWYNAVAWRVKRKRQLEREPLCRICEARALVTAATVADHIVPHREDYDLFWHGELQSLCASCHSSVKQAQEYADR